MLRGGSWNNDGRNLRAAVRNRNAPDNRNNNLGLRLASPPVRPRAAMSQSRERGYGGCGDG
ncbi:hypothetical protein [Candidatus Thiodictyon syntrophicum]|uniref:hypothetical protein n=1 Tax=Candidatus Thiodictyon syntrophicum TaxID=1166950 RepID=UPI001F1DF789|nr:hypothetical protein [Candidatus Thiodictyon syntrophicum]